MATATVTGASIEAAVAQLNKTDRGRSAMRHMLGWLDDDGLGLDEKNKSAALTLLLGAWGTFPGSARDAMRDALGEE